MSLRLRKIQAGEYATGTGHVILREDVPSLDEYDQPSGDVTWFVVTDEQYRRGTGLPEALYEAPTRRACVAWIEGSES